jgi:hypothetical protein
MGIRLSKIWAWIAVILPALLGLLLLTNPHASPQISSPDELARMVGIRNVVYSLILLPALLMFPNRVVALLLAGRGLTDLADGVASVASGAQLGPSLFPIVTSIISFAAAYYLYTRRP